ncbi:FHA domain-containing protein [uncultured Friedmanniella sp.]|uniref:FHA domain-containing protein n=1 Tax=uncultured Friedmanniella sp. TaxID=335381 RepID=UPI0035C97A2C
MPFCTNCGHDNPEGSNFCGQCGSALNVPAAAAVAPSPVSVPTPGPSETARVEADRPSAGDTTKTMAAVVEGGDPDTLLSADEEAAVRALPAGSALLIVQRGSNAGSRFLLNTESSTVGRHPESEIFLDDISVSRRHATFERTSRGTLVRDSGSLNGTYVNRDLVDEMLLQPGDEVQIGKFRLVYYGSTQA